MMINHIKNVLLVATLTLSTRVVKERKHVEKPDAFGAD